MRKLLVPQQMDPNTYLSIYKTHTHTHTHTHTPYIMIIMGLWEMEISWIGEPILFLMSI